MTAPGPVTSTSSTPALPRSASAHDLTPEQLRKAATLARAATYSVPVEPWIPKKKGRTSEQLVNEAKASRHTRTGSAPLAVPVQTEWQWKVYAKGTHTEGHLARLNQATQQLKDPAKRSESPLQLPEKFSRRDPQPPVLHADEINNKPVPAAQPAAATKSAPEPDIKEDITEADLGDDDDGAGLGARPYLHTRGGGTTVFQGNVLALGESTESIALLDAKHPANDSTPLNQESIVRYDDKENEPSERPTKWGWIKLACRKLCCRC